MYLFHSLHHSESLSSMKVAKKKVFFDERWSQNRNVTAMDWSTHVSYTIQVTEALFSFVATILTCITVTQHPELFLVSYYVNPNIPHDPDGVALMWDIKFQKDTPDYIFNCQVH